MLQINIYEAKRRFSRLLNKVSRGESVIISNYNKPVAELRPARRSPDKPRPAGLCAGEFRVPRNFNDPLPDGVLKGFE